MEPDNKTEIAPSETPVVDLPIFKPLVLTECVYLGGFGFNLKEGQTASLQFSVRELRVSGLIPVSYARISDIGISGPGTVRTGGGFIGGGFGVEGAVEGIALAGILNALTTRTKVHTFLSITCHFGELHVHYGGMEPGALRIAMSPVYSTLRRMRPDWMLAQMTALRWNMERGQITSEEYARYSSALARGVADSSDQGEIQSVATCEAQLRGLGFHVHQSEPGKWQIISKAGTTYAHSVADLQARTADFVRWAAAK